ncbi:MAG: hypothetical protein NT140_10870 [Deltaproteobacteria bacterium]|nr:hypothetical protein [Deltaproteobacteria bacterium]
MRKIIIVRQTTFRASALVKRCWADLWAYHIEVPTMKRKEGNTRSVGVKPCHAAWRNGQYMPLNIPA